MQISPYFFEKQPKKFGQFKKKEYLCIRVSENPEHL